jgi:hypothetical protein
MPFVNDGSVHHSGIRNEKDVCVFLNERSKIIKTNICSEGDVFEHRGGTSTKADMVIVNKNGEVSKTVSIKNHEKNGSTFDWLNSTKGIPQTETLKSALQEIKAAFENTTKSDAEQKNVKNKCETLFSEHLRAMNSDTIRSTLQNIYKSYTDYIVITDVAKNNLIVFDKHKNMKELSGFDDEVYFLKYTARAKTSAQIWRRGVDGSEINTGLRIRLVLNNGVSALLGLSQKNKCSVPSIKIQQDNVKQFIHTLVDPLCESYAATATATTNANATATTTNSSTDVTTSTDATTTNEEEDVVGNLSASIAALKV